VTDCPFLGPALRETGLRRLTWSKEAAVPYNARCMSERPIVRWSSMTSASMTSHLKSRGLAFAYLFGPPRFIKREEAYGVHHAVCEELGTEDLSFQYKVPESKGSQETETSSLVFERKEQGRGIFRTVLDHMPGGCPLRLLIQYEWPPPIGVIRDTLDMTAKAVFGSLEGPWQKVHAEVRLRVQCDAGGSIQFFRERVYRLSESWFSSLGSPLVFTATKFSVAASGHDGDPLKGARRELSIEVLNDDPRSLYLELVSQWPQLSEFPTPGQAIDPASVRSFSEKPSEYVEESYEYLHNRIIALQAEGNTR
jgi:hypothetical protein